MIAPERWPRIRRIFGEALARPAPARTAYVRAEAASDVGLAEEIEELLAKAERLGDFLEPLVPNEPRAEDTNLRAGDRIGRFTLVSEIGHGGMGVVWRAEQDRPRRAVALKLLQATLVSASGDRRFAREAELLARLSHPGIAQVYEAGTDAPVGPDGRKGVRQPWFALELVAGVPIDQHADEHGLDVRARVELVAKVCDAVQHAHERGIIHRDLKPANVLVTGAGQPKVLDFGVARAIGLEGEQLSLHTCTGSLLGTLEYMSPEQLAGDPEKVDARSDVYALGVVLHELLAGCRPHDVAGRPIPEALRILSEEEPAPISTLDRALNGDLETIVSKALGKERARRYASAGDLALDLRRFLDDRPIAARPPSTAYQLRKFARRNRALVAGVSAALLFLSAGIVGTTRGMLRAFDSEKLADARRVDAEHAVEEARAIQSFLEDTLAASLPDLAAGHDWMLARRTIDEARSRIEGRFAKQPLVEARLRATLGQSYERLGLFAEALAQHSRAVLVLRTDAPHAPGTDRELADRLTSCGACFVRLARFCDAKSAYAEALALARSVPGFDPGKLVNSLNNLAFSLRWEGRLSESAALLAEAADVVEKNRSTDDLALALESWGEVQ